MSPPKFFESNGSSTWTTAVSYTHQMCIRDRDIHTDVTEVVKAAKKLVDLIGADFIVSVGRGISKDCLLYTSRCV